MVKLDIRLILTILLFALTVPAFASKGKIAEERRLLADVRGSSGEGQAYFLRELAQTREQMGKFREAIDTWGYLKKTHGEKRAQNESSAPDITYAKLADFQIQRIKQVQNLLAYPPSPLPRELWRRLTRAQGGIRRSLPLGKAGYQQFTAPVDMDGDLIPEVFTVVGQREELNQPAKMFLLVFKWDGKEYKEAFCWSSYWELGKAEQPVFEIYDPGGYGMHAIGVCFETETDNGASILSNGSKIMWVYP